MQFMFAFEISSLESVVANVNMIIIENAKNADNSIQKHYISE